MSTSRMAVELYLIHTGFLDEEQVFKKKLTQVAERRREKVLSYKTREDQKRSLAAGLLLEYILNERGYRGNQIAIGENGKLYLPESDDFFENSVEAEEEQPETLKLLPWFFRVRQRLS